jgi:hypothetical protein
MENFVQIVIRSSQAVRRVNSWQDVSATISVSIIRECDRHRNVHLVIIDAIEDIIAFSCSGGWFKCINCLLFWIFLMAEVTCFGDHICFHHQGM